MAVPLIGTLIAAAAQTAGMMSGVGSTMMAAGQAGAMQQRSMNPQVTPAMKTAQSQGTKQHGWAKALFSAGSPQKMGKAAIDGGGKMLGIMKKMGGKAGGLMGISFSVSSLLRQSQLFTGAMGALFQIIGAFVDVLIAPFMPYAMKFLQMMASKIPAVAAWSMKTHDWIVNEGIPRLKLWLQPLTKAVGSFFYLWNNMGTPQGIWDALLDIGDFFLKISMWRQTLINDLGSGLADVVTNNIKSWGETLWNWLSNPDNWWSGPLHKFQEFYDFILTKLLQIKKPIIDIWNWLTTKISKAWDWLTGVFNQVISFMEGIGGYIMAALRSLLTVVEQYVAAPLIKAYNWVKEFLQKLWGGIKNLFHNFFSFNWLKKGFNYIIDQIASIARALGGVGIDTPFGRLQPFGALEDIAESLGGMRFAIEETTAAKKASTKIELSLEVGRQSDVSMPFYTEQERYVVRHDEAIRIVKSFNLGGNQTVSLDPTVLGM